MKLIIQSSFVKKMCAASFGGDSSVPNDLVCGPSCYTARSLEEKSAEDNKLWLNTVGFGAAIKPYTGYLHIWG